MATTEVSDLKIASTTLVAQVNGELKRLFPETEAGNVQFTTKGGETTDLATVLSTVITELESTATTANMETAISTAVTKAINGLVDGADERGDTLKELLALIDNNKEAADLLQTAVSTKVDKVNGKSLISDTLIAILSVITAEKIANWDKAQANVLESVKVNGVAQTITNKSANISVPVVSVSNSVPTDIKSGDLCFVINE